MRGSVEHQMTEIYCFVDEFLKAPSPAGPVAALATCPATVQRC